MGVLWYLLHRHLITRAVTEAAPVVPMLRQRQHEVTKSQKNSQTTGVGCVPLPFPQSVALSIGTACVHFAEAIFVDELSSGTIDTVSPDVPPQDSVRR